MIWMVLNPPQHSVSLYAVQPRHVRPILRHGHDIAQIMDTLGAPTPDKEACVSVAWDFLAARAIPQLH